MSNITLDEMKPLFTREIATRGGMLVLIFAISALAFLAIAYVWDKSYGSFALIQVDDQRPLTSVLDSGANSRIDHATEARKDLFSPAIMNQILDQVGFTDESTGLLERTRLMESVRDNTEVVGLRNGLVKIFYEHRDPNVAFATTSAYANIFVDSAAPESVSYSIAEPAIFPKTPEGLRFIHIAIGGLLLSLLMPFVYLFVSLKVDTRIRTESTISDVLELPLLATVPRLERRRRYTPWLGSTAGVVTALTFVFVVYVVVAFIKFGTSINAAGGV